MAGYLPDDTPPGTSPAPLSPLPKAPLGQGSSPVKRKYRGAPPRKKKSVQATKPAGFGK